MKTTTISTTICGVTYKVTARLFAEGVKFPNTTTKDSTLHNQFKIRVVGNSTSATFDWFDSHVNYTHGVVVLAERAVIDALYSFLADSLVGMGSFEEHCEEYGYDVDSRRSEKVYKACKKLYNKAKVLFPDVEAAHEEVLEYTNG